MNILVCLKQAPDTETKIKIKEGEKKIDEEGVNFVVNPYDEYAIEEALKIKEKYGGEVTIICLGPKRAEQSIRTGLAMGVDKAIHLIDPAFEGGDSLTVAKALAKAIKDLEYDLILCGKQAVDDDCAQVGTALAELLGLPQVNVVTKLELSDDQKRATGHREIEGATEVVETPLPAVISCQKGLNEPRYPSLPGIMKAKKKELKPIDLATLGLEASEVGEAGSKTRIIEMFLPPERKAGKIIEGEVPEASKELVKLLHEEAKVV